MNYNKILKERSELVSKVKNKKRKKRMNNNKILKAQNAKALRIAFALAGRKTPPTITKPKRTKQQNSSLILKDKPSKVHHHGAKSRTANQKTYRICNNSS